MDIKEESDKIPFMLMEQICINEQLKEELDKKDKIINEITNKLKEHIKFCEQEANGSLNNEICHISLKFNKSLLDILESEG